MMEAGVLLGGGDRWRCWWKSYRWVDVDDDGASEGSIGGAGSRLTGVVVEVVVVLGRWWWCWKAV